MRHSHERKIERGLVEAATRDGRLAVIVLRRRGRLRLADHFELRHAGEALPVAVFEATAKEIQKLAADSAIVGIVGDPTFACWGDTKVGVTPCNERVVERYRQGVPDQVNGDGVHVVVIDTGLSHHPDMHAEYEAIDVTGEGDPRDRHGHGTFIAGQILTLAPGAQLTAVRIFDRHGRATRSGVIKALDTALQLAPDFVNMSFGGPLKDPISRLYLDRLHDRGTTLVAAAGNSGPDPDTIIYPARFPQVIAVGACDFDGRLASFSSRGAPGAAPEKPDLVAEGVGIVSWASPDGSMGSPERVGFCRASGTSFACPIVASLGILIKQSNPALTPEQTRRSLREACDPLAGTAA